MPLTYGASLPVDGSVCAASTLALFTGSTFAPVANSFFSRTSTLTGYCF